MYVDAEDRRNDRGTAKKGLQGRKMAMLIRSDKQKRGFLLQKVRYSHPPANDTPKHLKRFLNLRTPFWDTKII
jgi:hypothetical protein